MKTETITLYTPRLCLRRFSEKDAEAIYNGWATDLRCMRYQTQTPHKNIEDTRMRLDFWIREYEDGALNWAIERKEDGCLIGNIKTEKVEKHNFHCEIGYCLNFECHGKGYATEALTAVLDYLIQACGFQTVYASHGSKNPASGKVMQKAGMKYQATLHKRIYDKTEKCFDDLIIYAAEKA